MYRIIAALVLILFAHQASAADCPSRYRFVDFGRLDLDGVERRGGTIFRAFDQNGTDLLISAGTVCESVEELAKDGRALPIPVVSRIEIDPEVAGLDVAGLWMMEVADVAAATELNANAHRKILMQPRVVTMRSETFLCAQSPAAPHEVSCQAVSPYGGNNPLVIYCDLSLCEMPMLGRDEQLVIGAKWPRSAGNINTLGQGIVERVREIYDLLESQI